MRAGTPALPVWIPAFAGIYSFILTGYLTRRIKGD